MHDEILLLNMQKLRLELMATTHLYPPAKRINGNTKNFKTYKPNSYLKSYVPAYVWLCDVILTSKIHISYFVKCNQNNSF